MVLVPKANGALCDTGIQFLNLIYFNYVLQRFLIVPCHSALTSSFSPYQATQQRPQQPLLRCFQSIFFVYLYNQGAIPCRNSIPILATTHRGALGVTLSIRHMSKRYTLVPNWQRINSSSLVSLSLSLSAPPSARVGASQPPETGIDGVGNKKVTSKFANKYQRRNWESGLSCGRQQVSAESQDRQIAIAVVRTNHRTAIWNCTEICWPHRSLCSCCVVQRFVLFIYWGASFLLCGVSFVSVAELQLLLYV